MGKGFLVIGGLNVDNGDDYDNSLFQLQCEKLECTWTLMEQKLGVGNFGFVAVFVPNSELNCY